MTKRIFTLELTFDVDQVTKSLAYKIKGKSGKPKPKRGRCAGTFSFNEGDELYVSVTANALLADMADISITNFTLASIPLLDPGKYYLSMFDQHRACIDISHWDIPDRYQGNHPEDENITIKSLHPLPIAAPNGQWELSGYLSMLINKETYTAPKPRLFYFDPESSTGSGGDIAV